MDENRLEGTARNVGGKVQESVGRATGDVKTKTEGVMNQAAGAAQDLYGQTADVARQTATTFDDWLRNTIETRPYTSAIVALGIGWLLGRMRRPRRYGETWTSSVRCKRPPALRGGYFGNSDPHGGHFPTASKDRSPLPAALGLPKCPGLRSRVADNAELFHRARR
jgi:uncharacterized protein YjbJ (UPF0337 family)